MEDLINFDEDQVDDSLEEFDGDDSEFDDDEEYLDDDSDDFDIDFEDFEEYDDEFEGLGEEGNSMLDEIFQEVADFITSLIGDEAREDGAEPSDGSEDDAGVTLEEYIESLIMAIDERDAVIQSIVDEANGYAAEKDAQVAELDERIAYLESVVSELQSQNDSGEYDETTRSDAS